MANNSVNKLRSSTGRGSEAVDISSADHTFAQPVRGVYVSVTGNIVGRLPDDDADSTWHNVPVGIFPMAFTVIRKTSTTATVTRGIR